VGPTGTGFMAHGGLGWELGGCLAWQCGWQEPNLTLI
jgi:hypothetical protein